MTTSTHSPAPGSAGMQPLGAEELRALSGGEAAGGPIGELLLHFLKRGVDCVIDDFDRLAECFKEGREAAS